MLDIVVNLDEPTEVVYFPEVPNNTPTIAVLSERIDTLKKIGTVLFAAVLGVGIYFNHKLSDQGEKLAGIDSQLGEVSKNLNRLLDRSSKNALANPGATATQIAFNAGAIREAATWARQRKIPIPRAELTDISERLLTAGEITATSPNLWGALAEIINFRTEIEKGADPATLLAQNHLRVCSTMPPIVRAHGTPNKNGGVDYAGNAEWENCYLRLDDPNLPSIMKYQLRCNNCVVDYGGGELQFRQAFLKDCVFVLRLSAKPSSQGLQLVRDLIKNPNAVPVG